MDQNNESQKIVFEGEEQYSRPHYSDTPKIIQLVMKYSGGYIKDEKGANYVLIGFVAVAIIVSLFLILGAGENEAEFKAPPGQKIIYPENEPPRLQERF